jgi:hypothetical protein
MVWDDDEIQTTVGALPELARQHTSTALLAQIVSIISESGLPSDGWPSRARHLTVVI